MSDERETKRYFHLISHLLHQDKIDFFIKSQFGSWKVSATERVSYIKILTATYVQLSKIYTEIKNNKDFNHSNEKELFKKVHTILQDKEVLPNKIKKIENELDKFKNGYNPETRQTIHKKPKKSKVYTGTTIRFEVKEKTKKILSIKTIQLVNILGNFKKIFNSTAEQNNINLTINLLSEVLKFCKGSLVNQNETDGLIRRYDKVVKNYNNFKYDFKHANDLIYSRKYANEITGKIILLIFLSLSKNSNTLIKNILESNFVKYQFETFSYNILDIEHNYEPEFFSSEEVEQIKQTRKRNF